MACNNSYEPIFMDYIFSFKYWPMSCIPLARYFLRNNPTQPAHNRPPCPPSIPLPPFVSSL